MSREVQVRFCESRAVQSRPATHLEIARRYVARARYEKVTNRSAITHLVDPSCVEQVLHEINDRRSEAPDHDGSSAAGRAAP
jgi:hypothetical protein